MLHNTFTEARRREYGYRDPHFFPLPVLQIFQAELVQMLLQVVSEDSWDMCLRRLDLPLIQTTVNGHPNPRS
jgi:hypothetical protein